MRPYPLSSICLTIDDAIYIYIYLRYLIIFIKNTYFLYLEKLYCMIDIT